MLLLGDLLKIFFFLILLDIYLLELPEIVAGTFSEMRISELGEENLLKKKKNHRGKQMQGSDWCQSVRSYLQLASIQLL